MSPLFIIIIFLSTEKATLSFSLVKPQQHNNTSIENQLLTNY
jgi:hypothetical protein